MAEDNSELLGTLMGMLGDNPEEKIAQALSSLGIGESKEGEQKSFIQKEPEREQASASEQDVFLKLGALLSGMNQDDERARLLHALKPFLSAEKQPKVDSVVKILKLIKMAETAGQTDILKRFKL